MMLLGRKCCSTSLVRRRSSVLFHPIVKLPPVSFYPGSSVSPSLRSKIQRYSSEKKHPVCYRPMASTTPTLFDRLTQHGPKNQAAVDDPTKKQPMSTIASTISHGHNNDYGRGNHREGSGRSKQGHGGRSGSGDGRGGGGGGGRGGRGYSSSGRGGRGKARDPTWSQRSTPNDNHSRRPPPAPVLVTDDFPSMHQKYGVHAYKVHKPGCQCPKIKQVRSALQSENTQTRTTMPEESKDDQIYQSSLASASTSLDEQLLPLDGLVVIPDTKTIPFLYLCLHTGIEEFQRDSMASEKKLQGEMFPNEKTTKSATSSPFKASCASCLLEEVPNGFVCVASSRQETVDMARDWARQRADEKHSAADSKEGKAPHSDHAHYVCSLSQPTMNKVLYQARTRQQTRDAAGQIMEQFVQQGLPAQVGETVELGHHLKSLLQLFSKSSSTTSSREKYSHKYQYWLVLVYDDRTKDGCWTIDLPGGKRHLGETTFQCAIRETEEESSLRIDATWKSEENPRTGSDAVNAYYFLTPPPLDHGMLMEQITENKFWKSPGLE